jgi:hypothetical protein
MPGWLFSYWMVNAQVGMDCCHERCHRTQRANKTWVKLARGPACWRRTPHFSQGVLSRRETELHFAIRYQPACKPGFVGHRLLAQTIRDGHSSGTTFARCLEQPTRTASLTSPCGVFACANSPRCRPYSVLLPVWFAMPVPLPDPRCALTAPFHPYFPSLIPPPRAGGGLGGGSGSFSVALSLGSPPPDVIRHRMSMEPGLSSPAAFRP